MPSFDIVSEVDSHELTNAVDQARRIITTRFDFKGVDASFELEKSVITITAEAEFQIEQLLDILKDAMIKRKIDIKCLETGDLQGAGKQVKIVATIKEGLDKDIAKKVVKAIKDSKLKVQSAIQGEQVRITGKKRDDLQAVMALMREQNYDVPLQFNNFRD